MVNKTYLEALDFDQFFQPVNDDELTVLSVLGDVPGVKPALGVQRGLGAGLVPEVALGGAD